MRPRLACADYTFPLLPHDKVLQLIALLEFEGVDIGLFEGRSHLWPSREYADLAGSARRLRARLGELGLAAADLFLQLDPEFAPFAINQPDAGRRRHAREQFARTLEYASALGAHHVTGLPGVEFEGEAPEASWGRAVEELAWRVERAAAHGIVYGVEPHVGSLIPRPDLAARLVGAVPGLTLSLDYTHFTRVGTPDVAIEPLVAHAKHLHIRGARPGRLQAPLKENTVDYARVLRAAREAGYAGWLAVEYVWIDWEHCNECDNVSESILFRDLLRRLTADW